MQKGREAVRHSIGQIPVLQLEGQPTLAAIFGTYLRKKTKSLTLLIPLYHTGEKHTNLSGIVSWQTCSISSVMTAIGSILSVSCIISFKLFLLKPGREKQKSLNVLPSTLKTPPLRERKD